MNLVIGNSSQLSHYFPEDYMKISSRKIDLDYLKNKTWDKVYITFAEQRIYNSNIDYITPNYIYTMDIINALIERSQKIVCYTSCELWNNLSGSISTSTEPSFYPLTNEYCISKLLLLNKIKELRKTNTLYQKVIFIHPFYFNSVYRSEYFLFGKIFQSILQKKPIQVGNLNFYRDIVHPKFIVEQSIKQCQDCVVGSGKLFNVRDFIKDLYRLNDISFEELVQENTPNNPTGKEKLIMAKVDWDYTYDMLLSDTQRDIEQCRSDNGHHR